MSSSGSLGSVEVSTRSALCGRILGQSRRLFSSDQNLMLTRTDRFESTNFTKPNLVEPNQDKKMFSFVAETNHRQGKRVSH